MDNIAEGIETAAELAVLSQIVISIFHVLILANPKSYIALLLLLADRGDLQIRILSDVLQKLQNKGLLVRSRWKRTS